MRLIEPPEPVVVRRDHRWCDGEVRARRRGPADWRGYVRSSVSPGMRYLEWVPAERLRQS